MQILNKEAGPKSSLFPLVYNIMCLLVMLRKILCENCLRCLQEQKNHYFCTICGIQCMLSSHQVSASDLLICFRILHSEHMLYPRTGVMVMALMMMSTSIWTSPIRNSILSTTTEVGPRIRISWYPTALKVCLWLGH
jgi:hypothetical protein